MANWRDRVELRIERGLRGSAAGAALWDEDTWDSGEWGQLEPVWELVEMPVQRLSIDRGRERATQRHTTGKAELVIAWPTPADGVWSFRPTSPLGLGMEVRIRARRTGTTQWRSLYRGAVRELDDDWAPKRPFVVTAGLVDRFAELAAVDLEEQPVAGGGERADQRLRRILDLARINRFYGKFQVGQITLTGSNFARNLLDEAQVTVESEIGTLYANRDNFLVFRGRHWWQIDPRSTNVQLIWTNVPLSESYAVSPSRIRTRTSLDDVENYIAMARTGGNAQVAADEPSIAQYGKRTHRRFDLLNQFSSDAAQVAAFRLDQQKQRTERLDALTTEITPDTPSPVLERLLDIELGDLHRVYADDDTGTTYDKPMHVMGVNHSLDSLHWRVSVRLWDYVSFTPTAGWNVAVWDTDLWI